METNFQTTARDYLRIIFQRLWIIVVIFLVSLAIPVYLSLKKNPNFACAYVVRFSAGPESPYLESKLEKISDHLNLRLGLIERKFKDRKYLVELIRKNSDEQRLRELVKGEIFPTPQEIERTGLKEVGPHSRSLIQAFLATSVSRDVSLLRSGQIRISAHSPDKDHVQFAARTVANNFGAMDRQVAANLIREATEQIQNELEVAKRKRQRFRANIDEYRYIDWLLYYETVESLRTKEGLQVFSQMERAGESGGHLVKHLQSISRDIFSMNAAVKGMERALEERQQQIAGIVPEIIETDRRPHEGYLQISNRLSQLKGRLEADREFRTMEHPYMRDLVTQIKSLEAQLQGLPQTQIVSEIRKPNREYQKLEADIRDLKTKIQDQQIQLKAMEQQQAQIFRQMKEKFQNQEALEQYKKNYQMADQKVIELEEERDKIFKIRELDFHQKNLKYETPAIAMAPTRPKNDKWPYYFLVAAIIWVAVSVTLLFFYEYLDHSIKGIDDAKRFLDVPIIGAIPHFDFTKKSKLIKEGGEYFHGLGDDKAGEPAIRTVPDREKSGGVNA